jgi:hypothetical protein
MSLRNWTDASIPIYVTRKSAEGRIGQWSVSPLAGVLLLLLVTANVLLWGVAGIIVALGVIF